ncbi:hypothetical protein AG1IA_07807 [Rhizoctonia solani AG-1 IA]|uniref:Uncharacterized protein n=1 Tax=Thanatephorus cucumeris (strain AG1-IA) TaxID=983506 RepID=L8WMX8_THACA|nr:hypothetical protein AG1IA_07807 [Rhizoctonia solani AG-1 IA]
MVGWRWPTVHLLSNGVHHTQVIPNLLLANYLGLFPAFCSCDLESVAAGCISGISIAAPSTTP